MFKWNESETNHPSFSMRNHPQLNSLKYFLESRWCDDVWGFRLNQTDGQHAVWLGKMIGCSWLVTTIKALYEKLRLLTSLRFHFDINQWPLPSSLPPLVRKCYWWFGLGMTGTLNSRETIMYSLYNLKKN